MSATVAAPPEQAVPDGSPQLPGERRPLARRRAALVAGMAVLAGVLVLTCLWSLAIGSKTLPPSTAYLAAEDAVLDGLDTVGDRLGVIDEPQRRSAADHAGVAQDDYLIVRDLRVPRTVVGLLVGSALGLAGAVMQGVTRNPLADPSLLGVSAGAAFGVVLGISQFGIASLTGYAWFGLVGAGIAFAFVYALGSRGRGGATPVKLALAGAALSALVASLTTAMLLLDSQTLDQYRFWVVGSLAGRDAAIAFQVLPFLAVGTLMALACARPLNALGLGEDVAAALGLRVGWSRLAAATSGVLLAGAATAAAGPIAFVGLTVPHVVRAFTGPDHRWLLPGSMLAAPILLLGADVIGRIVNRPGELQVGIVTAVIGAPFFIALVRRRKLAQL